MIAAIVTIHPLADRTRGLASASRFTMPQWK
jgi:hypothetical protein